MKNHARLMEDYKKFRGFVPCGMEIKGARYQHHGGSKAGGGGGGGGGSKKHGKHGNKCPYPYLPPCRDPNHPDYQHRGKWAHAHKRFFIAADEYEPCKPKDNQIPPGGI